MIFKLILVGLLCTITVHGAKQLCQEVPEPAKAHAHLKNIEHDFQKAKQDAEVAIAELKKNASALLEDFEKEYHNFISNYQVLIQLMEQKPSFCERLIQELDDSIKFFVSHTLQNAKQAVGTH